MSEKILVPDVGDADNIEVVELLVAAGDVVEKDESLVVLESDKASMEIPSPFAGKVVSIAVNVGDTVGEGDLILDIEAVASGDVVSKTAAESEVEGTTKEDATVAETKLEETKLEEAKLEEAKTPEPPVAATPEPGNIIEQQRPKENAATSLMARDAEKVHAGPAVRKQAREYGVELTQVSGTGKFGRILKEDIQQYVKGRIQADAGSHGGIPAIPVVDFTKFGEVELKKLSRVRKASARNLHRSWLNVPHVTQFDEADITDLEAFRKSQNIELAKSGVKITPLAFLIKAVVACLQKYPQFNASIEPDYEHLIIKKYINIGVAVETDDGLVVPVIKAADEKGVIQLAEETANLAAMAREKKLPMDAMQGATFTISSLGGIGGTAFTPIVNAPEVAILGVSRSKLTPVYFGDQVEPRLMLPLSLSYDHRAIDGAEAARFTHYLGQVMTDLRRVLL